MPTTRATELAQMGSLVTANPSTSTVTVGGTLSATTLNPNNTGFRNRIINGDMRIWQRGTTFAVGSTTYTYTADRFKAFSANTSTTVSRSTSVPDGFQYSFQLQRPNGNTGTNVLLFTQIIETSNCYDLAGQSVTLSFWVKKGANYSGGNLVVQVLTGTAADQGGDPYAFTGLASPVNNSAYTPTTTWSKVTYTGTFASNVLEAALAIAFTLTGTAGADDSIYITGVQLEAGSTATEFERRPYGTELALCQRYFYKHQNTNGSNSYPIMLQAYATTAAFGKICDLPVTMRTNPTSSTTATSGTFTPSVANGTAAGAFTATVIEASTVNALCTGAWTGSSGLVPGNVTIVLMPNNAFFSASAEL